MCVIPDQQCFLELWRVLPALDLAYGIANDRCIRRQPHSSPRHSNHRIVLTQNECRRLVAGLRELGRFLQPSTASLQEKHRGIMRRSLRTPRVLRRNRHGMRRPAGLADSRERGCINGRSHALHRQKVFSHCEQVLAAVENRADLRPCGADGSDGLFAVARGCGCLGGSRCLGLTTRHKGQRLTWTVIRPCKHENGRKRGQDRQAQDNSFSHRYHGHFSVPAIGGSKTATVLAGAPPTACQTSVPPSL